MIRQYHIRKQGTLTINLYTIEELHNEVYGWWIWKRLKDWILIWYLLRLDYMFSIISKDYVCAMTERPVIKLCDFVIIFNMYSNKLADQ